MRLKDLFRRGKDAVDDRGGSDALKEDAQELRDIARGEGSVSDKAKQAADAIKEPGAPGEERPQAAPGEERPQAAPGEERPQDAPGEPRPQGSPDEPRP